MSSTAVKVARDLDADLAICEAASPGKWLTHMVPKPEELDASLYHYGVSSPDSLTVYALTGPYGHEQSLADAEFIADAREGWPYAIHRAQENERENDRLREEIKSLREQINQHHLSQSYD
jgi:hypothetical protein